MSKPRRTRRSFLKAALGCAAALVVPGSLPTVDQPVRQIPVTGEAIWALEICGEAVYPSGVIVALNPDSPPVHLHMGVERAWQMVDGEWEEVPWNDVVS